MKDSSDLILQEKTKTKEKKEDKKKEIMSDFYTDFIIIVVQIESRRAASALYRRPELIVALVLKTNEFICTHCQY